MVDRKWKEGDIIPMSYAKFCGNIIYLTKKIDAGNFKEFEEDWKLNGSPMLKYALTDTKAKELLDQMMSLAMDKFYLNEKMEKDKGERI